MLYRGLQCLQEVCKTTLLSLCETLCRVEDHEAHEVFFSLPPSILRTVEATSIKWLFANQFEEITWNRDADSNSRANSPWYPVLIHHYPGYHSTFFLCTSPISLAVCEWSFSRLCRLKTPKSGHVQQAIAWTFFILSHPLVSPFTLVSRFAGKPRSPRMARKASVMQATITNITSGTVGSSVKFNNRIDIFRTESPKEPPSCWYASWVNSSVITIPQCLKYVMYSTTIDWCTFNHLWQEAWFAIPSQKL